MKRTSSLIASLAMLCLATSAGTALAAPVYVDASTTNTVLAPSAGGGALTTNGTDSVDGIWRLRTSLGIDPATTTVPTSGPIVPVAANNVFESTGNNQVNGLSDDVPRVVTTVAGLPSNTYNVWAIYWIDQNGSPWRIRAGLTDTVAPLPLFVGGGAGTPGVNEPTGGFDNATGGSGTGRKIWKASLGQVTGTSISVFVEDAPATSGNERTWYDGIAYEAVPEPASLTMVLAAACAGGFMRRRR